MFSDFAKIVKRNLGVTYAKFDYSNNGKEWSVKINGTLDVKGGFVKAPEGVPAKSVPKHAETYDFLFGPSSEKVVGITEYFGANVGEISYDITGRYSSSGSFKYKGQ